MNLVRISVTVKYLTWVKKNMLLWMQKVNLSSQKLSILNSIEI